MGGLSGPPSFYGQISEGGTNFSTGVPVRFPFTHRKQPHVDSGTRFAQHLEPAGRYILFGHLGETGHHVEPSWRGDAPFEVETIHGHILFRRPIVLRHGGYGDEGWKANLSTLFGGETGGDLTDAILRDGFDGIVTVWDTPHFRSYVSEIVDLRGRGRENPGHVEHVESLLEGVEPELSFEDYFPETALMEKEARDPYYGRDIIWDSIAGQTVRVPPENVTFISGNIFDPQKLAAIIEGLGDATERLVFDAPYGNVGIVTPVDVRESIEYQDYDVWDRSFTTGDDELDEFLVSPDNFSKKEQKILKKKLKAAQEEGDGDLGDFTYNIRDGNHRAFAAFIYGEPYIYMILSDNEMQDIREHPQRGINPLIKEELI